MIRPLWTEIDLKALRKNLKTIRFFLGGKVKIVAVIKQAAYGHGLIPVARELRLQGIDFFGVGSIEEAISLREDGFRGSIITLTSILDEFVGHFVEHNITPTIVDVEFAKKLDKEAAKQKVIVPAHIKIDTGMGRLGIYYKQAYSFVKQLSKLKNISLEGIYTHFPVADTDADFTNFQIGVFNDFISRLKKDDISFKFCHCANSIGITKYPNAHFNMVRPGLVLYGITPSFNSGLCVEPVLSLKSRVVFVKEIQKGMSVGYGRTYIADKARSIATVSVGYADGYPWALSSNSKVIINDRFFDLVGRVCMDHIMIDLKDTKGIKPGDEVTLIGKSKNIKVGATDMAEWGKTIPYEIVSRLSLKIPRMYKSPSKDQSANISGDM